MKQWSDVLDLPGIKYASLAHPGALQDSRGFFRVVLIGSGREVGQRSTQFGELSDREVGQPDRSKIMQTAGAVMEPGWYWFPIGTWTGRQKGPPRGPFKTVPDTYMNRLEEYGARDDAAALINRYTSQKAASPHD
jgi:hypothetical protein